MFDFLFNLWHRAKIIPPTPIPQISRPAIEYHQPLNNFIDDLLFYHNTVRRNKLILSNALNEYAQFRADVMAKNRSLNHTTETELKRLMGRNNFYSIAENIASGQRTPGDAIGSWLNSPEHRQSLLNGNYKYVGFGCAEDSNGRRYWCAIYAG